MKCCKNENLEEIARTRKDTDELSTIKQAVYSQCLECDTIHKKYIMSEAATPYFRYNGLLTREEIALYARGIKGDFSARDMSNIIKRR